MSSPYRDDAIEYRRTVFGLPGFFGLSPGGITPYDWPSQYGILPSWLMMMCVVSPVAAAPTIRFVEITLPLNGVLFLYVFTGTSDWSQYGLASRKSCFLPAPASDSEYTDLHRAEGAAKASEPGARAILAAVARAGAACGAASAPIGTDGRRRGAGGRQRRRGHPGAARAGGGAAHSSFAASPPTAAASRTTSPPCGRGRTRGSCPPWWPWAHCTTARSRRA